MTAPKNLQIIRRFYEVWNAGDLRALAELLHPEIVMHHAPGWPEPGPSVGPEAVMREIKHLREAWQGDTLEAVSDLVDANDTVVARDVWRGTGTGPNASMEFSRVFTLRDGKISSVQIFWDHDQALDAVGLRE